MKREETRDEVQSGHSDSPATPRSERRPWIAPAVERLDLREAMAAAGTPKETGASS